jgi:A/G-specific adenine glycosylase
MSVFSEILHNWYTTNARDLPWRRTSDPYLIWLSEIILQQTRVDQGLDYYLRFVNRFPDVRSLAQADEDEVLHYWQGLGYYSRARNLHEAAKSMNGSFPTIYNKVLELKGVGPYTAAAICSIAYGMPYAVVDGNVYRVLSRYFDIETPIDSTEGKKEFAEWAQSLLDKDHPGEYNQAIMDFGAIQCTPAMPRCHDCPLSTSCLALAKNKVNQLPIKNHKTKTSARYFNYLLIRTAKTLWLHKRTDKDIWHNLYELPLIETPQQLDALQLLENESFHLLTISVGNKVQLSHIERVKHVLSHRIIYTDFYSLKIKETTIQLPASYFPIPITEWRNYAMPQLVYRFLEKNTTEK